MITPETAAYVVRMCVYVCVGIRTMYLGCVCVCVCV